MTQQTKSDDQFISIPDDEQYPSKAKSAKKQDEFVPIPSEAAPTSEKNEPKKTTRHTPTRGEQTDRLAQIGEGMKYNPFYHGELASSKGGPGSAPGALDWTTHELGQGWRGLKEMGQGIYGMGKDVVHSFYNPSGPPTPWLSGENSLANKYLFEPAEREKSKSEIAYDTGHTLEGIGHGIAAGVPLIGPWVAGLAEQAGTDPFGALARGGTQVATGELVPRAIGRSVEGIPKAINKELGASPKNVRWGNPAEGLIGEPDTGLGGRPITGRGAEDLGKQVKSRLGDVQNKITWRAQDLGLGTNGFKLSGIDPINGEPIFVDKAGKTVDIHSPQITDTLPKVSIKTVTDVFDNIREKIDESGLPESQKKSLKKDLDAHLESLRKNVQESMNGDWNVLDAMRVKNRLGDLNRFNSEVTGVAGTDLLKQAFRRSYGILSDAIHDADPKNVLGPLDNYATNLHAAKNVLGKMGQKEAVGRIDSGFPSVTQWGPPVVRGARAIAPFVPSHLEVLSQPGPEEVRKNPFEPYNKKKNPFKEPNVSQ